MFPNEPGLEETEDVGTNAPVDELLEPTESEAENIAEESQASDVSESEASAETIESTQVSEASESEASAEQIESAQVSDASEPEASAETIESAQVSDAS